MGKDALDGVPCSGCERLTIEPLAVSELIALALTVQNTGYKQEEGKKSIFHGEIIEPAEKNQKFQVKPNL